MRRQLAAFVASGAFIASSGTPMAHHSFAMFDQENPIELEGTVQEFKYTSPHSYLLLAVKGPDGSTTVWNLEGRAPSLMARDGWTSGTLQPGDEIILTIQPLRSGAPGGSWNTSIPKFKGGRPLRGTPQDGPTISACRWNGGQSCEAWSSQSRWRPRARELAAHRRSMNRNIRTGRVSGDWGRPPNGIPASRRVADRKRR